MVGVIVVCYVVVWDFSQQETQLLWTLCLRSLIYRLFDLLLLLLLFSRRACLFFACGILHRVGGGVIWLCLYLHGPLTYALYAFIPRLCLLLCLRLDSAMALRT